MWPGSHREIFGCHECEANFSPTPAYQACVDRWVAGTVPWELCGGPGDVIFWHGRLLMMPHVWRAGVPMNMLISQHRDGRLIADTIAHFGLGSVAGSSSKGGAAAVRQIVKAIRAGEYAGVTPDGPRGP